LQAILIFLGSSGFQVISKMKASVGRASYPRRLEACTTVSTTIPGEPFSLIDLKIPDHRGKGEVAPMVWLLVVYLRESPLPSFTKAPSCFNKNR
jgi:hypothetical protein